MSMTTENSLKDDDNPHAKGGHVGAASLAVNAYLQAIADEPGRGRPPKSSAELEKMMADEPNLAKRLVLVQRQLDAVARESQAGQRANLEARFVRNAKTFGDHYGISYAAWRSMGVQPLVLREAGISGADTVTTAHSETRPMAQRRKMTPEFAKEIMDVWEAAGGDKREHPDAGSKGRGKYRGNKAVAEKFGYHYGYASSVIADARACLAGQPTRKIREAAAKLQSAPPEALAANTG
jgi:hypothetical protein